jgi:thioredoxin-like negative regulator of GroEL
MEATAETFADLVREGTVLVDFWGPNCAPCLALMPHVETAIEHRGGAVALVKVNAPEQRQICRDLRVFGLPTYLVYREAQEIERLTGDPSIDAIEEALDRALERG